MTTETPIKLLTFKEWLEQNPEIKAMPLEDCDNCNATGDCTCNDCDAEHPCGCCRGTGKYDPREDIYDEQISKDIDALKRAGLSYVER